MTNDDTRKKSEARMPKCQVQPLNSAFGIRAYFVIRHL